MIPLVTLTCWLASVQCHTTAVVCCVMLHCVTCAVLELVSASEGDWLFSQTESGKPLPDRPVQIVHVCWIYSTLCSSKAHEQLMEFHIDVATSSPSCHGHKLLVGKGRNTRGQINQTSTWPGFLKSQISLSRSAVDGLPIKLNHHYQVLLYYQPSLANQTIKKIQQPSIGGTVFHVVSPGIASSGVRGSTAKAAPAVPPKTLEASRCAAVWDDPHAWCIFFQVVCCTNAILWGVLRSHYTMETNTVKVQMRWSWITFVDGNSCWIGR